MKMQREKEMQPQEEVQEGAKHSGRILKIFAVVLLWGALCGVALTLFPPQPRPPREPPLPEDPKYEITKDYIPVNPWSRPGKVLEQVEGVVIHYVGNPGSSAKGNRDYFAGLASGETGVYASSHFIVGLEGEVIQCIPLTEISHASNHRNGDTISIEVCHPDAAGQFSLFAYDSLIELTAWLCNVYELDPSEDVIRHYDVIGKRCPRYYVDHPEAWMQILADVDARMEELTSGR